MIDAIEAVGIIPILTIADAGHAAFIADSLVEGGVPCAEVTLRTEGGAAALATMAGRGDLLVGAGTVTTVEQVDRVADLGAAFVVSPGLDEAVVERTLARGMLPLPGIATASELQRALSLGVSTVKLFPAALLGGIGLVRALGGPFPGVRFIPSGGIRLPDVTDYLMEPNIIAVGCSWLVGSTPNRVDITAESRLAAGAVAAARVSR